MGLCAKELVVSGLRCDLVHRYTQSVVLFLMIYNRGSSIGLSTVPGFQVLVWWSSVRTGCPCWIGLRVGPAFWL